MINMLYSVHGLTMTIQDMVTLATAEAIVHGRDFTMIRTNNGSPTKRVLAARGLRKEK